MKRLLPLHKATSSYRQTLCRFSPQNALLVRRNYSKLPLDSEKSIIAKELKSFEVKYVQNPVLSVGVEMLSEHIKSEIVVDTNTKHFLYTHLSGLTNHDKLFQDKHPSFNTVQSTWLQQARETRSPKNIEPPEKLTPEEQQEKGAATANPPQDDYAREKKLYQTQEQLHSKVGFEWMMNEVWLRAIAKMKPSQEVFLSYGWPVGDLHKESWTKPFVEKLALHLTQAGMTVYVDEYHSGGGYNLRKFMRRIKDVDYVLLISSRTLGLKLENENTGVSYENSQIQNRVTELKERYLSKITRAKTRKNPHFLIPVLLNMRNYTTPEHQELGSINACEFGYEYTIRKLLRYLYDFGEPGFNKWWSETWLLHCGEQDESAQRMWGGWLTNVPDYVRRDKEENFISRQLRTERDSNRDGLFSISLWGMDGVGKTQIARKVLNYSPVWYTQKFIFTANSSQRLLNDYAQFARDVCGFDFPDNYPLEHVGEKVKNWLEAHPGWLAVYINFNRGNDDRDLIQKLLPKFGGHIIYTSNQSVPEADTNFCVPAMTEAQCDQLSQHWLGEVLPDAQRLYREFDRNPSWLRIAFNEIKKSVEIKTVDDFLKKYHGVNIAGVLERKSTKDLGWSGMKPYLLMFANIVNGLEKDKVALTFIRVCSLIDTNKISYPLLNALFGQVGPIFPGEKTQLDDLLNTFDGVLLEKNHSTGAVSISNILASHIRHLIEPKIKMVLLPLLNNMVFKTYVQCHSGENRELLDELRQHYESVYQNYGSDFLRYDSENKVNYAQFLAIFANLLQLSVPLRSLSIVDDAIKLLVPIYTAGNQGSVTSNLLLSSICDFMVVTRGMKESLASILDEENNLELYAKIGDDLFSLSNNIDEFTRLKWLDCYGEYLHNQGNNTKSKEVLQAALDKIDYPINATNAFNIISVHYSLSQVCLSLKQYDDALLYAHKALDLNTEYRPADDVQASLIRGFLANVYDILGFEKINFHYKFQAKEYAIKAMKYFRNYEAFISEEKADSLRKLFERGQQDTAIRYAVYDLVSRDGELVLHSLKAQRTQYVNTYDFIKNQNDLASLDALIQQQIQMAKTFDENTVATFLINIADALTLIDRHELALSVLDTAQIKLTQRNQRALEAARLFVTKSCAWYHKGDFTEASKALMAAFKFYSEHEMFGHSKTITEKMQKLIGCQSEVTESIAHSGLSAIDFFNRVFDYHFELFRNLRSYDEKQIDELTKPLYKHQQKEGDVAKFVGYVTHNPATLLLASGYLRQTNVELEKYFTQIIQMAQHFSQKINFKLAPSVSFYSVAASYQTTLEMSSILPEAGLVNLLYKVLNVDVPVPFGLLQSLVGTNDAQLLAKLLVDFNVAKMDGETNNHLLLNSLLEPPFREHFNSIIYHDEKQVQIYKWILNAFLHEFIAVSQENVDDNKMLVQHAMKMIDSMPDMSVDPVVVSCLYSSIVMVSYVECCDYTFSLNATNSLLLRFEKLPADGDQGTTVQYYHALLLYCSGLIHQFSDLEKAKADFNKAHELCKSHDIPQSIRLIAGIYFKLSEIADSEDRLLLIEKGKNYAQQLMQAQPDSEDILIECSLTQVACFMSQHNIEKASAVLNDLEQAYGDCDSYDRYQQRVINLQAKIIMAEEQDYHQVIPLLTTALELPGAQKYHEHHIVHGETLALLGQCYLRIDPKSAGSILRKAMNISHDAYGDSSCKYALSVLDMANYYFAKNDNEATKEYYDIALNIYSAFSDEAKGTFEDVRQQLLELATKMNKAGSVFVSYPKVSLPHGARRTQQTERDSTLAGSDNGQIEHHDSWRGPK